MIGVRKATGRFEAHAWVELRGVVLNDSADVRERFAAFDRAIRPARGGSDVSGIAGTVNLDGSPIDRPVL